MSQYADFWGGDSNSQFPKLKHTGMENEDKEEAKTEVCSATVKLASLLIDKNPSNGSFLFLKASLKLRLAIKPRKSSEA